MQESREYLKCAVLCYGCMLDLDGFNHIAEAARIWGFVNPCAGKSVEDLPHDVPLFIARAGRDEMPHLNETLDRFLGKALTRNLPLGDCCGRLAAFEFSMQFVVPPLGGIVRRGSVPRRRTPPPKGQ